jgi:hypothetical protein
MGVSPHSGWAAVVALGRAPAGPRVLARSRIDLIDGHFPESKQPYHAVVELAVEEAAQHLDRYRIQAEGMAGSAIRRVEEHLAGQGYELKSVGILESSGRKGGSLHAILASHALIHTADGDHFRNALAAAAERGGLDVCRVPARDLDARAEAHLHRSLSRLQKECRPSGVAVAGTVTQERDTHTRGPRRGHIADGVTPLSTCR